MPAIKTKRRDRTLVLEQFHCQRCGDRLEDSRRGEMRCVGCGQEYALVPEAWLKR